MHSACTHLYQGRLVRVRAGEVSTATFRKVRVNGVGKKRGGERIKIVTGIDIVISRRLGVFEGRVAKLTSRSLHENHN